MSAGATAQQAPRAEGGWSVALRRCLADRHLVRLQLSWAAVMVASWAATVSLSVLAYAAGGSAAVAVAVLARTLPGAVVGLVAGSLTDRLPRGGCLRWSALTCAAACAAAAAGAGVLPLVVALVTVVTLATMLFRAAQSAVVPQLVGDTRDLAAANVLSSAVESLGVFAGPALAALLLALQGPQLALGAAAGLFAVAGLLLVGLHPPRVREEAPSGPAGGTRELARSGPVRLVLGLLLAQTLVSGGLVVLHPALAVDLLGAGLDAVGLLVGAFGLGGVLASGLLFGLAGSRHLGAWTCGGLLLWSLPLLLVPVLPHLAPVLVLLAVVGSGNVLVDVTTVTLLQRAVPARLLGRVFGALETVVVVGLGLGAVAAPLLAAELGAGGAVAVLGAPLALVALLALPALRRLDSSLRAPVRQVALLRAVPSFALLPPVELERLALQLQEVELAAGEDAVRQGEPGRTWFLLERGSLQVRVDGRHVRELLPGATFGEVAVLRGGVRSATVTALEPSVLHALDGAALVAALRTDGGQALAAVDAVAHEHLAAAAPARGWSTPG